MPPSSKWKQTYLISRAVKYSFDKFDKKVDYVESKYLESTNEIDKIFAKDNIKVLTKDTKKCTM